MLPQRDPAGVARYLQEGMAMNDPPPDAQGRWGSVKAALSDESLQLGPYFSYIIKHSPRRLLHALSYYKFAAKMIGSDKRVIEVGCSEGLGTVLLAEHAQFCLGVDTDSAAIEVARATLESPRLHFEARDLLEAGSGIFDAAVCLDVIEHIERDDEDTFVAAVVKLLEPHGVFVIGTPNIVSDQYASEISRLGHVNLFSADRLRALLYRYFHNVFMFSANDELVHTGFAPLAHYLIALCVGPRERE